MGSGGHGVRILEPPCIDTIVVGDAFDLAGNQVGGDILDLSGGNTAVNGAGLDPGALQYHCAGGNDGPGPDAAIIKHSCTNADKTFVFNDTSVNSGVMADRDPVAHDDRIKVTLAVENRAVLNV